MSHRARALGVLALAFITACTSASPAPTTQSTGESAPSGGSASPAASSSAGEADLDAITERVDAARAIPEFAFSAEAFDASALAGKTVFNIPASSGVPFNEFVDAAEREVAELVGLNFVQYPNQGTPSEWAAGIQQAITQEADVIILQGAPNPEVLQPQLRQAAEAGIPVVVSHRDDIGTPLPENVSALVPAAFTDAALLMADWTILDSGGDANVLLITTNEFEAASVPMEQAIIDEFELQCPTCTVASVDVPGAQWATGIQTAVQSELTRDPTINYVLPMFDGMVQFAAPGITAAGRADDVNIVTFNGTPFVLEMLQGEDIVVMDVGENLNWIGWANMDQAMRLLAGLDPVASEETALRIFDSSNVDEAGSPPEANLGYGDAYIQGYKDLWGLP